MKIINESENFKIFGKRNQNIDSFCPICKFNISNEFDKKSMIDLNCCNDCEFEIIKHSRVERLNGTMKIDKQSVKNAQKNRRNTKYK